MNWAKSYLAKETNLAGRRGSLARDAARAPMSSSASPPATSSREEMVRSMAPDPIVFALAVPEPEIAPAAARAAGAQGRRHRPLRLPEHDGHLARLPRRLPRPARLARPQHPPAHADLRRPGAGRHGPAGRAARRLHRAPHLRFPGRPGDRRGGRPRRARGRRGRARYRAGAGQRADAPLRLRGTLAPARSRPPAASTRRSARRRSTCGGATAACSRSAPRSRSAITTS